LSLTEITKKNKLLLILYILLYAVLTGFISTALINIQFGRLHFSQAVIYGILGPHFLKERLTATFQLGTLENLNKVVDNIRDNSTQQYEAELNRVKKNISDLDK
jgi:hypothetical protein